MSFRKTQLLIQRAKLLLTKLCFWYTKGLRSRSRELWAVCTIVLQRAVCVRVYTKQGCIWYLFDQLAC